MPEAGNTHSRISALEDRGIGNLRTAAKRTGTELAEPALGWDSDRNATAAERRAQRSTRARWARRPARRSYRRRPRDATDLKQDHGDTLQNKRDPLLFREDRVASNGIRLLPETVRHAALRSASGIVPSRSSPSRDRYPGKEEKKERHDGGTCFSQGPQEPPPRLRKRESRKKGSSESARIIAASKRPFLLQGRNRSCSVSIHFCFGEERRTTAVWSVAVRKAYTAPAHPAVERLRNKMRGAPVPARSIASTDTPLRQERNSQADAAGVSGPGRAARVWAGAVTIALRGDRSIVTAPEAPVFPLSIPMAARIKANRAEAARISKPRRGTEQPQE